MNLNINFSSIFLKLHFIFGVAFILLIVTTILIDKELDKQDARNLFEEAITLSNRVDFVNFSDRKSLIKKLQSLNYQIIKEQNLIDQIVFNGEEAYQDLRPRKRFEGRGGGRFHFPTVKVIEFDGKKYFWIQFSRNFPLWYHYIFIEYKNPNHSDMSITGVAFVVFVIILINYLMLLNSLLPLKKLKKAIKEFGETKRFQKPFKVKKDEISIITEEFYTATQKIEDLENSRKLFLRNIIHELKTPLTKGKLQISLMEDNEDTQFLNTVFTRLDNLINELANLERLASGNFDLKNMQVITADIKKFIDNAVNLGLFKEDDFKINNNLFNGNLILKAEITLFSIAIKNLIDNGIKYSKNKKVEISVYQNRLEFDSVGKKLPKNFDDYLKPFSHFQVTTAKGFGLGLYITNEILKKHKFKFKYEFFEVNSVNRFSIIFN